jgi:hypothetical protein
MHLTTDAAPVPKETEEPPSPTPEQVEAAGGTLPSDAARLAEYASGTFREHLDEFLAEQLSGKPAEVDWIRLIGTGSLVSVLRMIAPEGECPLSEADFSRIVAESSFKQLFRLPESTCEESARAEAENWQTRNQRRLALIQKSMTERLSPDEESELQQLQAEIDKRLESHDDRLLQALEQMRKAAEPSPDPP